MCTISSLVYQLKPKQQKNLISLLQKFAKEGINEVRIEEKDKLENIIKDIEKNMIRNTIKTKAYSKGETTIPKKNWGVHEHHCCSDHGCKYGDVDCPVSIGLTKQIYKCEDCDVRKDNYSID